MARIALVHDVAGVAAVQAELLRKAGHEVDQIALPDMGAAWRWPAKAAAIPLRFAAYMPTIARLRGGHYDVVHIHWLTHGIVGVLSGRPFFAQAHGSDLHVNLDNPVYRRVTTSVLKHARKVFYVTPNLRSFLEDYDDKAIYLPNPVELRGIAAGSVPPPAVKKVLIFTRLDPVKGVEHIFPAVERLAKSVELTGLDWGPLARDYVRRYKDRVKFVKPIPHEEIGAFLREFDLVIGQMRQGILSLMEIEALAAGRPLVTDIDWSLYSQDPPPVIAASGPDAIVAAVEKVGNDPDALTRLAREGREWVLRNHSYAHHLQLLESAYFGAAKPD
ncbi:MAG TPA: glycosyltransferase family 4 protein [Phenylobacterium sp.]|nr:glycosyltransferase family 4 protein [Phenylobacterium sp.]